MRRGGKAMQQDDDRATRIAGFPIEDVESLDSEDLASHSAVRDFGLMLHRVLLNWS